MSTNKSHRLMSTLIISRKHPSSLSSLLMRKIHSINDDSNNARQMDTSDHQRLFHLNFSSHQTHQDHHQQQAPQSHSYYHPQHGSTNYQHRYYPDSSSSTANHLKTTSDAGSQLSPIVVQHLIQDIHSERRKRRRSNMIILFLLIVLGVVSFEYWKLYEKFNQRMNFEDLNKLFRKDPSVLPEGIPAWISGILPKKSTTSNEEEGEIKSNVDLNSEELKKWIQIAKSLKQEREYNDCIRVLENILWKYPSSFVARELYGLVLLEKGLYRSALKQFEQSIIYANSPTSEASCYNNMGVCFSRLKQHKEAVIVYDKAIQTAPFDAKNRGLYFFNRAISHQHNGDYQLAINDYSRSIAWEEGSEQNASSLAKKYKQRASCYFLIQQYEKSEKDYSQCILYEEQDKNASVNHRAETYFLRANDYRKLKNYTSALADLDRAIELKKTDAALFHARAVCYRKLGNYEKALENHTMALNLKPNSSKYKDSMNKTSLLLQQERASSPQRQSPTSDDSLISANTVSTLNVNGGNTTNRITSNNTTIVPSGDVNK
ncbi:hypothetical protein C9374_011532 [Naegleria lovaniensis]|uniref:Uncharacterized protein n=1 Tax=Naegleria lovaniensis TaxID=51637 RepID=A0AA88H4F7_NAELO|nr:uncharacterized protein C9374_011532 [Naegleria lovaniensis]KAG2392807.1 hypothetical protein C9374_011532 [Naegleria lovaniensis]